MSDLSSYDVAAIRIVPRVDREEFLNAGVVLLCRSRRFLGARLAVSPDRLARLATDLDIDDVRRHLTLVPLICSGGAAAGVLGALTQQERFHWLTTPRSTVIQPGPVHSGLCADPRAEIERLFVLFTGGLAESVPPAG